jgi:phage gp36-like protein
MPYVTAADIDATYGTALLDLLADTAGEGERDAGAIARAIEQATATVNSYVSSRHSLPLPQVPPVLVALTMDLAVHRLALRPGLMTEEIESRWKAALKTLEAIGAGRAGLGLDSPSPAAQASDAPVIVAPPRRFPQGLL